MTICTHCNEDKPREAFGKNTQKKNGIMSWCKVCYKDIRDRRAAGTWESHRDRTRKALAAGHKQCTRCDTPQPLSAFSPARRYAAGVSSWCRQCTQIDAKARKYQISREMVVELTDKHTVCESCGNTNHDDSMLSIDHCHTTGEVRGILCRPCNLSLGLLRDDPKRLVQLAAYINERGKV